MKMYSFFNCCSSKKDGKAKRHDDQEIKSMFSVQKIGGDLLMNIAGNTPVNKVKVSEGNGGFLSAIKGQQDQGGKIELQESVNK